MNLTVKPSSAALCRGRKEEQPHRLSPAYMGDGQWVEGDFPLLTLGIPVFCTCVCICVNEECVFLLEKPTLRDCLYNWY